MTWVATIFSCAKELHKIVIKRWRVAAGNGQSECVHVCERCVCERDGGWEDAVEETVGDPGADWSSWAGRGVATAAESGRTAAGSRSTVAAAGSSAVRHASNLSMLLSTV